MSRRHKKYRKNTDVKSDLPRLWLMTDPKLDGRLLKIVQKMPFGSGVILRHYDLNIADRHRLFRQLSKICRRRGHKLLLGADADLARKWGADGVHLPSWAMPNRRMKPRQIISMAAHDPTQLAKTRQYGADMILLSPVYITQSHIGAHPLGPHRFRQLAKLCGNAKPIALGGMTRAKAQMHDRRLIHGWAAIDALKC